MRFVSGGKSSLFSTLAFVCAAQFAFGGAGTISCTPNPIAFGNVIPPEGYSAKNIAIKNTGSVAVSIEAMTTTGGEPSLFVPTPASGIALPHSIAAGQTVTVGVLTFTPPAGPDSTYGTTLVITSTAASPTLNIPVTGSGYTHLVTLNWTASTTPPSEVAGYNIYRATRSGGVCGAYTKMNSVTIVGTEFTDKPVIGGTTYCYVGTALGAGSFAGMESAYSSPVALATIPGP